MTTVENEAMPEEKEVKEATDNVEELHTDSVAEEESKEDTDNVEELNTDSEVKEEVDYKAKYYYLAAEMDNLMKRTSREKENFIKYGNEKVISSLLDIMDNLDRTLNAFDKVEDEQAKALLEGVLMVQKQFAGVLQTNGVTEVKTLGEKFDPNFHEAMTQVADEEKEEEEIIQEFQKGYILNGRLIRAAKVVVVKNS
ncbi:MAG: nucleotide exchange factor GrpE [Bdellovibrionales bacterium]|jgi:molecular chaperone GrpE|nr:nucleotide exchange factor GrpE [Bdellovibrionales bacterium]